MNLNCLKAMYTLIKESDYQLNKTIGQEYKG